MNILYILINCCNSPKLRSLFMRLRVRYKNLQYKSSIINLFVRESAECTSLLSQSFRTIRSHILHIIWHAKGQVITTCPLYTWLLLLPPSSPAPAPLPPTCPNVSSLPGSSSECRTADDPATWYRGRPLLTLSGRGTLLAELEVTAHTGSRFSENIQSSIPW